MARKEQIERKLETFRKQWNRVSEQAAMAQYRADKLHRKAEHLISNIMDLEEELATGIVPYRRPPARPT